MIIWYISKLKQPVCCHRHISWHDTRTVNDSHQLNPLRAMNSYLDTLQRNLLIPRYSKPQPDLASSAIRTLRINVVAELETCWCFITSRNRFQYLKSLSVSTSFNETIILVEIPTNLKWNQNPTLSECGPNITIFNNNAEYASFSMINAWQYISVRLVFLTSITTSTEFIAMQKLAYHLASNGMGQDFKSNIQTTVVWDCL